MESKAASTTPPTGRTSLLDTLFFSWANNVWFGIAVLATIFVYSSLGSAIPPLRQHPWFEMTEMEWFNWWPFKLMIALMCTVITVVTIKQIPLRLLNAGVWMIHSGIITLCAGSAYYFSTKLEGDTPIFRRQAVISIAGQEEQARLIIRPGNHISIGRSPNDYHFTVSQIFPEWVIASGRDKGKKAHMTWIDCVTPQERFTRQLLAGYPQYTEDILPDGTRARKTLGRPLVDRTLEMTLDYVPQTEFFLMDSSALYTREHGAKRWIERPVENMPRYHEHIASHDEVFLTAGDGPLPLRPIDIPVQPAAEPGDPLADYQVRVQAYLRYAFLATQWREGGERLNPVARVTLSAGPDARIDYELVAFDRHRYRSDNGQVVMRWVDSAAALDQLVESAEGRLIFRVAGNDLEHTVLLGDIESRGSEAAFTPIDGTEFAFRVKAVMHDLMRQSGESAGQSMSVASLEIKTPEGIISRFVADVDGASRDLAADGEMVKPDPSIEVQFRPGIDARVTLVTGPPEVGTWVLFKESQGGIERRAVSPGRTVAATDQVRFRLNQLFTHAVEDIRPRVVPREQRDRDARASYSMIKVEIAKGDWSESIWLDFNHYALPGEQYAIPRRIHYHPSELRLPDGRVVELMYSRQRHPLPVPVALDTFELATHAGGYTGATITIRDFISQLRFKTEDGWSDRIQMSSNRPAAMGGFWFFQATWDPPAQGYAGMNYTGAGVGNRNGVYIQLAGTCIAVTGMLFAFYVKPIIRRRMQDRTARHAAEAADRTSRTTADRKTLEPVGLSLH
ncbi:MAG: hypothetical protein V3W34_15960 [Phycisphaerae bacterium]